MASDRDARDVPPSAASDVAWVTCVGMPEPDPDEDTGIAALAEAGLRVERLAWDDVDAAPPETFAACVLRSPWNYYEDPEGFDAWLERAASASRLFNGLRVARWNLHKRYLAELDAAGVPVVPTEFVERGASVSVSDLARARGWSELVVKPAISGGSFATRRFATDELDAAQRFLDGHVLGSRTGGATRDMMIQCFVPSVETEGERCFVWIDGELTHAIDKRPRFSDDDESVSEAIQASPEEQAFTERVLRDAEGVGGFDRQELLYARVDTVLFEGRRVISELELLEPSLFFLQSPRALGRFVSAVATRVGQARHASADGTRRTGAEDAR